MTDVLIFGDTYQEAAYLQSYIGNGGVWQRPVVTEVRPTELQPTRNPDPTSDHTGAARYLPGPATFVPAARPEPSPVRRTRTRAVVALVVVIAAMTGYGFARLVDRTTETVAAIAPDTTGGFPWGAVALVAALLLLRVAFKAGKYARGYQHARGIRKSHWAAIGGRHK